MPNYPISPTQLPWPVNWSEIFGRGGPILLEIGFGNGRFLVNLALERPEAGIIGIEIASPSIQKARNRIEKSEVSNVRIIRAAAELALWTLFDVGLIEGVYINFPDPWPKAKHQKRRLISERFLHLLATRMAKDGHLDIATDHQEYAMWIMQELDRSPYYSSRFNSPYIQFDPDRITTKYEQKALAENSECYFFKWRRNRAPSIDAFPTPLEFPMPHVIIDSAISIDELAERLDPFQRQAGEISIRVAEYYRSVRSNTLLCDTFINEAPLDQRIMMAVFRRETGDVILQLHGTGYPRPTAGAKLAIQYLAEEVGKLDPQSSILRHNLGEWESTS